ncbi:MAG TPA: RtcB family protein [Chitinophaga sp.]|uniref:RtcB family protein n=1 Tax=Chitinophaga sp. TaxID=1869181 RepID=UPI002F932AFD
MPRLRLTGKALRNIGYPEGPAISVAITAMEKQFRHHSEEAALDILKQVLLDPMAYLADDGLRKVAGKLMETKEEEDIPLKEIPVPYEIYGAGFIETGALQQMNNAVRLPVAVAGALMPDAHHGYGLPIGGVLATHNAVIPYGVGVDIGCRMCLSILDLPVVSLERHAAKFKKELVTQTEFGAGATWVGKTEDAVLEHALFREIPMLRHLHKKAVEQLGTSGSGNHFVEWGIVQITGTNEFSLPAGAYVGLLSHSGSRGLGAQIAAHYTRLARELCQLPRVAQHFAWLELDKEAGQEYWAAMNLAGDYASACHNQIHRRLIKAMDARLLARVENHHNFAWKEIHNGQEVIVHRKGATPAGKGVLGIIPGSMTAPGYIVRGRGEAASLHSASHGAGRAMSRFNAAQSISQYELNKYLKEQGVILVGGGPDEAPMAYKNINEVMAAQSSLVDVIGRFQPKIVRMADDGSKED